MSMRIYLSYIILLLTDIPALTYALMPLKNHLRFSSRRTAAIAGPALALIILFCAFCGVSFGMVFKHSVILSLIPLHILYMYLTEGSILMRLFGFFNSTMIMGNGILYGMLLAAPLEKDGQFLTMRPVTCVICLFVTIILGALYYITLTSYIPYLLDSEHLNLTYNLALSITVFITLLFFWVMPKYATVVMTGRVRSTILTFLLLGPCTFLLIYRSMWRIAVSLTENSRLREYNEFIAMEQKRYEELSAFMDETRKLRHDFRQHLIVMDGYAKSGDTERISEYIRQFTESMNAHRSMMASNPALDAVAAHYDSVANQNGIHIKWLIALPRELPLKESDFITIFGNLVENAVTAVQTLPEAERIVYVNTKMLSDEMLGLTVKNPYQGAIRLNKNGLPMSDKPGHGIGLSSIKSVIDCYDGTLDINTDDGVFTAGVLLYLHKS